MPTDADLLRADETSAFDEFVARHYGTVRRYVARRLGPSDADEVVNDVFLAAHRHRDRYDAVYADARPWLLGIATNLIRRRHRAESRALRAFAKSGVDPVAPDESPEVVAFSAEIAAALGSMRPKHRDVLFLYSVAELTLEEIARALDVPVGTVKAWLHRARAHAVAQLAPRGPTPTPSETET